MLQRQWTKGVKVWESWGWGTVPNALLKLLVKDKPLYSVYFTVEKVCERRETKPPRREKREVTADERQTGSWKLRERLKITVDKDQPARKVSSWNLRWNNITAEKHQRKRMIGSWNPAPTRENWDSIECYAENSICCHNSYCFNSVPFKAKMSCKHGYIGHANMLYLFTKISWLSFTQSLMNVCSLIRRVVI